MPVRLLPRTNAQRITAMRVIQTRLDNLVPALADPIAPVTAARLAVFYPAYIALIHAQKLAKTRTIEATAEVTVLRNQARLWVSHGYMSIVNATVRGTFPKSALVGYGLAMGAQGGPKMKSESAILTAATRLQNGETVRVAAGGQPIAFPSVAEIMVHANAFKAVSIEQGTRSVALADAQKAIKAANKEADKLILRLWNEVETAFSIGDRPSLRRKAREWGVVYVQNRAEPPSAETNAAMGIITDSATGKPLRWVRAIAMDTEIGGKTNARGRYALPLMHAGQHTVQFSCKGYIAKELTITVTEGQMTVQNLALDLKDA